MAAAPKKANEDVQEQIIRYSHEEPLQTFLERNKPSQINEVSRLAVRVHGNPMDPEKGQRRLAMIDEYRQCLLSEGKAVTKKMIEDLAVKYRFTSGKWLIVSHR